jgi:glycosyltransferase involved in cell wall biosynthesis
MNSHNGKLSVCIVSHNSYGAIGGREDGFIGGVEWQTSLLARWLAARGHKVSLLTWDEGGPAEEHLNGVRVLKICRREAGLPGVRFFYPKWTGLIAGLRKADADVYYQNSGECVTGQIALWCQRQKKPFVFSAASDADCRSDLPELKTRRERLLYRYGLRRANSVVVQTKRQQELLNKTFGRNSLVIPMPCPSPESNRAQGSNALLAQRVLWVGRVCPVKRPERLLKIAAACPLLHFDLVGPINPDEYGKSIEQDSRALPNLTLHGGVPRDRMGALYERASLLCSTSDYEGFPNTFLEAWSHGLPVVSRFDPDGLIARKQMGLVAHDVPELKDAILKLLSSDELYQKTSANGLLYFQEQHTAERVLPQFEELLVNAAKSMRAKQ